MKTPGPPLRCLLALLCALSACGGPKAGDTCNAAGYLCADELQALECRTGRYVALPCRGTAGCRLDQGKVSCDLAGALAGDACATSSLGKGLCATDGKGTLECRDNADATAFTWVKTKTCSACAVASEIVACTP